MSPLPPLTTPLVKALTWRLMMQLTTFAIGRMKDTTHGEECAGKTFELLTRRERKRYCWNPKGPWTIQTYTFRTCRGVMSTFRRWLGKNEEDAIAEMDEVCPGLHGDATEAERQQSMDEETLAEQVHADLAAHPKGDLPVRMLRATSDGFEGSHEELARHCGAELHDVREAQRLITRVCDARKEEMRKERQRAEVAEATLGAEAMRRDREARR